MDHYELNMYVDIETYHMFTLMKEFCMTNMDMESLNEQLQTLYPGITTHQPEYERTLNGIVLAMILDGRMVPLPQSMFRETEDNTIEPKPIEPVEGRTLVNQESNITNIEDFITRSSNVIDITDLIENHNRRQ